MKRPKELTPFGIEIKQALLRLRISQKEFCEQNKIPEQRFSEILYGVRPNKRYRDVIVEELGINRVYSWYKDGA